MQCWHSNALKTGCSVRILFKSRAWNTQAARYIFLVMYPGPEPAKFSGDPLKQSVQGDAVTTVKQVGPVFKTCHVANAASCVQLKAK